VVNCRGRQISNTVPSPTSALGPLRHASVRPPRLPVLPRVAAFKTSWGQRLVLQAGNIEKTCC